MLTFAQLRTPVTRDEALATLRQLLATLNFSSTSWQSGSVQLTILYLCAEIYSRLTSYVASLAASMVNKTSTGDALTAFSDSHYDNQRTLSETTQGKVHLALATGAGPYNFEAGAVVVANTFGTRTFRNIESGSLSEETPAIDLTFEAEVAGSLSNVANNSITKLITTLAGVTVTNPAIGETSTWITRQGRDEEIDDRLRTRNRTKWTTFSVEAVKDTVLNLCLNASPAITKVAIDDQNPRGPGTVDVHVAGDLTTVSGPELEILQADLDARFFGNDPDEDGNHLVHAYASDTADLDLTATVYYSTNYPEATVIANVEAALIQYLKDLPLGGSDYRPGPYHVAARNDIVQAIEAATGVRSCTVNNPSGDIPVENYTLMVKPSAWNIEYIGTLVR